MGTVISQSAGIEMRGPELTKKSEMLYISQVILNLYHIFVTLAQYQLLKCINFSRRILFLKEKKNKAPDC